MSIFEKIVSEHEEEERRREASLKARKELGDRLGLEMLERSLGVLRDEFGDIELQSADLLGDKEIGYAFGLAKLKCFEIQDAVPPIGIVYRASYLELYPGDTRRHEATTLLAPVTEEVLSDPDTRVKLAWLFAVIAVAYDAAVARLEADKKKIVEGLIASLEKADPRFTSPADVENLYRRLFAYGQADKANELWVKYVSRLKSWEDEKEKLAEEKARKEAEEEEARHAHNEKLNAFSAALEEWKPVCRAVLEENRAVLAQIQAELNIEYVAHQLFVGSTESPAEYWFDQLSDDGAYRCFFGNDGMRWVRPFGTFWTVTHCDPLRPLDIASNYERRVAGINVDGVGRLWIHPIDVDDVKHRLSGSIKPLPPQPSPEAFGLVSFDRDVVGLVKRALAAVGYSKSDDPF